MVDFSHNVSVHLKFGLSHALSCTVPLLNLSFIFGLDMLSICAVQPDSSFALIVTVKLNAIYVNA